MSKLNWLIAAIVATTTGCAGNSTSPPNPKPPTGAPRQAKGQLPMGAAMAAGMKPKTVSAVKEKAGKPAVGMKSTVSASGSFSLTLEVGVRYMFVITLDSGTVMSLSASDTTSAVHAWLPIGNPLDGDVALDFGSVTIVNNVFISNTVLLDMDWDEDGIADFADDDDDNDGTADLDDHDIDGDGLDDDYLDADSDGLPDLSDPDDDDDGISDSADQDDDGDGIPDDQEQQEDEVCDDGIDNDDDGFADEDDSDCPSEEPEICDDGIDNDDDGLVDEDDSDCPSVELEICDDGVDNDDDGLVDEEDPDCAA